MQCLKEFTITIAPAGGGCNGLPRLPADGTWSEVFLSPGSTYTFDGATGAASLVSTAAVSSSGSRETDVCNSGAAYTYTVDLAYTIIGAPFNLPPFFEPRLILTLSINNIAVMVDTSPILGNGSVGTLSVNTIIPGDSASRNIDVTIEWDALANNPPPTSTASCTLTGTVT